MFSLFLQFTMFNLSYVNDLAVMLVTEIIIFATIIISFFSPVFHIYAHVHNHFECKYLLK